MQPRTHRVPSVLTPPEAVREIAPTVLPRCEGGIMTVGGSTVVVDVAGLRFVADPTFETPGTYHGLHRTDGPAVSPAALADVDVVLSTHVERADTLDPAGRVFALSAPRVLTSPRSARLLGGGAVGLSAWSSLEVAPGVRVLAVPARSGPANAGEDGAQCVGFVIQAPGTTIYLSGENTSLTHVAQIRRHVGVVDHAVIHAGRAVIDSLFHSRPVTLSAAGACGAAQVLESPHVLVVHDTAWEHLTEGPWDVSRAFHDAGLHSLLDTTPQGSWADGAGAHSETDRS